jgi:hypothetical protein
MFSNESSDLEGLAHNLVGDVTRVIEAAAGVTRFGSREEVSVESELAGATAETRTNLAGETRAAVDGYGVRRLEAIRADTEIREVHASAEPESAIRSEAVGENRMMLIGALVDRDTAGGAGGINIVARLADAVLAASRTDCAGRFGLVVEHVLDTALVEFRVEAHDEAGNVIGFNTVGVSEAASAHMLDVEVDAVGAGLSRDDLSPPMGRVVDRPTVIGAGVPPAGPAAIDRAIVRERIAAERVAPEVVRTWEEERVDLREALRDRITIASDTIPGRTRRGPGG